VARDLIKSPLLTTEISAELFAQKGIGAFRFWPALIEWSQSELQGLQKICVQAYKIAWHVPWSTVNSLYTFPTAEGGHECPLPSGVLTQALLQHVDNACGIKMLHKNHASAVSKHIGRVALQLIYILDYKIRLERGKQRLLVTIGKVVA